MGGRGAVTGTKIGREVTLHATPYQTSSVPDQRRILIVNCEPGRHLNSATSYMPFHELDGEIAACVEFWR